MTIRNTVFLSVARIRGPNRDSPALSHPVIDAGCGEEGQDRRIDDGDQRGVTFERHALR